MQLRCVRNDGNKNITKPRPGPIELKLGANQTALYFRHFQAMSPQQEEIVGNDCVEQVVTCNMLQLQNCSA